MRESSCSKTHVRRKHIFSIPVNSRLLKRIVVVRPWNRGGGIQEALGLRRVEGLATR
jgi:hypothetical protein